LISDRIPKSRIENHESRIEYGLAHDVGHALDLDVGQRFMDGKLNRRGGAVGAG
jgi:hypothetical protein